jgi:hypothetical protein
VRHAGVQAIGGARALLDVIGEELENAHHRGMVKAARLVPHLDAMLGVSLVVRATVPSLIEYPFDVVAFPACPTIRRLH